jgi:hypothetical protein
LLSANIAERIGHFLYSRQSALTLPVSATGQQEPDAAVEAKNRENE